MKEQMEGMHLELLKRMGNKSYSIRCRSNTKNFSGRNLD